MKARTHGFIASLAVGVLLVVHALSQDFGFTAAGGPGGPTLMGLVNQGVTGARTSNGFLNTTISGGLTPAGGTTFNALDVATGDFNGDGLADIAPVSADASGGSSLILFLGLGDGTFGLPLSMPVMNIPTAITAADIDLDGVTDIAVAGVDFPSDVSGQLTVFSGSMLMGNGSGMFSSPAPQWLDGVPVSITTGRLNGDGFPDIAVGLSFGDGTGGIQTLLAGSSNPFAFSYGGTTSMNQVPLGLATGISTTVPAGASQPDTDIDIFAATARGVQVFENSGTGTSYSAGSFLDYEAIVNNPGGLAFRPVAPVAIVAADVNGDNIVDILALNRGSGTISTFVGNSALTGGYAAPLASLAGANPVSLSLMNFDNDRFVDAVTVHVGNGTVPGYVNLLRGNGTGVFTSAGTLGLPTLPSVYAYGFEQQQALGNSTWSPSINVVNYCATSPGGCGSNFVTLPTTQWSVAAGALNHHVNATVFQPSRDDDESSWLDPLRDMARSVAGWLSLAAPRSPAAHIRSAAIQRVSPAVQGVQVIFTATGASSGDFFEMQIVDAAGRIHRGVVPDGVVLEPIAATPAAVPPRAGVTSQNVAGFCVDFAKDTPAPGTRYRIAPLAAQAQFAPLRNVLAASRQMALNGLLHPDGGGAGYYTFVRQYSVWAKRENWDMKKFGDAFVERTKKNVVAMKATWTQQMEQGVRAAIPGRWRDVEEVLRLSNQIATPPRK